MRIAVTGATGFVGRRFVAEAIARGQEVVALSRDPERASGVLPVRAEVRAWDPARGVAPAGTLDGADAVMHLAGAGIADARWTAERKALIRSSRVDGTRALVGAIAGASSASRPRVLLSASAIGYYGDRGDAVLTEEAAPGTGFLADVCRAWEHEAAAASAFGVRTVVARLGVVLGRGGGALARMLPLFRLGLGGPLGSGRQWMSWIHLDDLIELLGFVLEHDHLCGPVNAVAPAPVTNAELTAALGRAVGRPAILPAPAPVLRVALGEMADAVLEGQRVHPAVATAAGFRFRHPAIDAALAEICSDDATELVREQWVPRPPAEVFAFFSDAHNLERITPPFLQFRITGVSTPGLQEGTRIDYRLSLHGVPVRWQSLIRDWKPDRSFVDEQTRGPYRLWEHTHEFEPWREGTIIRDRVRYALPLGALGEGVAGGYVARDLEAIFAFRRTAIREIFG